MRVVLVVCEAPGDFQITSALCERVLQEEGPEWFRDLFEQCPESFLVWRGPDGDAPYLLWKHIHEVRTALGVRPPLGHFAGRPAAADALAGRNALAIARHLRRARPPLRVDAVLLVRDMDDQPARREGLEQARDEATEIDPTMAVLIAAAFPEIEAWLIEGFEPLSKEEEALIARLRRELGFDPRNNTSALTAKHDHDRKSCKRVLGVLTQDDRQRKEQCYRLVPLATLRDRGQSSGLARALAEIASVLLPLCAETETG